MSAESERLGKIADKSLYSAGVYKYSILYSGNILERHVRGDRIIEVGPAEGVMTDYLVRLGKKLTVVEGASKFCEDLRTRYPHIEVVQLLAETYEPSEKADTIVLGHVLEHVDDPVTILRHVKEWLSPNGIIFAAVPNSRSIHRQAAVIMGMLDFEEDLNETDMHHGHRRVYNPETFRRDFHDAGLHIDIFGGYWIKPVSNRQIEEDWSPEMVQAFMELGERYPDIAAEIYVVASVGANSRRAGDGEEY